MGCFRNRGDGAQIPVMQKVNFVLEAEYCNSLSWPVILVQSSDLSGSYSSNLPAQVCGLCHRACRWWTAWILGEDGLRTLADTLSGCFSNRKARIATLLTNISPADTWEATLSHVYNIKVLDGFLSAGCWYGSHELAHSPTFNMWPVQHTLYAHLGLSFRTCRLSTMLQNGQWGTYKNIHTWTGHQEIETIWY